MAVNNFRGRRLSDGRNQATANMELASPGSNGKSIFGATKRLVKDTDGCYCFYIRL